MVLNPKLGIIAGNGRFPFLVLDAARAQGYEVVVADRRGNSPGDRVPRRNRALAFPEN